MLNAIISIAVRSVIIAVTLGGAFAAYMYVGNSEYDRGYENARQDLRQIILEHVNSGAPCTLGDGRWWRAKQIEGGWACYLTDGDN
jgi:hypothetical protein